MEEKILIKSECDKKIIHFFKTTPVILLGIAILCSLLLSIIKVDGGYVTTYYGGYSITWSGWDCAFYFNSDTAVGCFLIFVIGSLSLLAAITIWILFWVHRQCELCVTENNVKGKTLLGKEVVLPLYMISAYSTRKFLSTIAVATSSGITKFSLIGNYVEIGKVLSQKINQRQTSTITNEQKSQNNSTDEMFKLKSYLDAGIITQEEFDEKKKQLLGL